MFGNRNQGSSDVFALRQEMLKVETQVKELSIAAKQMKADHAVEIRALSVEHDIKLRQAEAAHQIKIKELENTHRFAKDEELTKARELISDMKEQLAVALKEKDMMRELVSVNADIVKLQNIIELLAKKLPEININGGLTMTTPSKHNDY